MSTSPPPSSAPPEPFASKGSENLKKIQAISLTAVGVFALFSYFFHIDYFPLFDFQAASSYLFAVAWVLGVLLLLLVPTLLLPYLIIGMTLKTPKSTRGEHKLSAAIIFWVGFSMLSLSALAAGVLLTLWLGLEVGWGILIGMICSLLLCALSTHLSIKKLKNKHGTLARLQKKKFIWKLWKNRMGNAALIAFLEISPLWVLMLMFSGAAGVASDDYVAFFAASLQCAGVIAVVGGMLLHVAFIPRLRRNWLISLCIGLALPLALGALSKAPGVLPMTMAQLTKIGNFRAEKLVLSPKACSSIAPILGINCDEKTAPPIELCNVHIMSRIGPETYLRIASRKKGEKGKYLVHHIFLPTAEITAMQVDFAIKSRHQQNIDDDLAGHGSECGTTLTTLHDDSAFDFDDFSLTDSGKQQLLTFVQQIKKGAPAIHAINVTGHADQIGKSEHNDWLSRRRAQEVKLFLQRHLQDFSPTININDISKGSTQPLMRNCGNLKVLKERIRCETPNRRVELEIVKIAQLPAAP